MDKRTKFIPEEKWLNLTIQDGSTQIRLSNLSSEQTKLFVSYGFLQDINCIRVPIPLSVHSSRLYTAIFVLSLPHMCMLD